METPVYLDHMSTTPVEPRARAAMDAVYDLGPANPHASSHHYGWQASDVLDEARRQVAGLIGASASEVLFTSGATEANNWAITGAMRACGKRKIVTSAIEHPCVLETARALEREGHEAVILPVDGDGLVDPDNVADAIDEDTGLVSIMLANNETATIEPVAEIAAACRARGVLCHTDAVQAAGRIPIDVEALGVDLLSLSAHKMYGPLGIGALYVRSGVAIDRLLHGGGQQGGLRAGTVPAPLAAGFGRAAEIARDGLADDMGKLAELAELLFDELRKAVPGLVALHPDIRRLPGCLNVRVPGVAAEDWLLATPEVAASTGAACASGVNRPSHVMQALGLSAEDAAGSLRLSVGRMTTRDEVEFAAGKLIEGLPQT